ncbi:MAG: hypothetical protein ABSC08_14480, partial [Bryobacteraceae bacterium]
ENLFAAQWSPDEKQMFALDADTWHPRILDIGKGVWRLLNERRIAYPRWSRDGKYICGMQAPNSRAEAHRIEVATGRREVIARSDFNTIANLGFWLGYTQDMEPLTIRDLSSTQIYRIDLDR